LSEQNMDLVAYCGLYCGDCLMHKGEVADLARDLRKKLRETKFERVAKGLSKIFKDLENYEQCYQVLGTMVRLRCRRACRQGGGPPACKMRNCCQRKGIQGCWECEEFETCQKLEFLRAVHGEAHLKNLRKIKKQGISGFVEGPRSW
jgi:hypothetical protein